MDERVAESTGMSMMGDMSVRPSTDPPASAAASPAAARTTRSRWRDPRLVVGVAVVAVCTLLGARLLAGADDTVGVWAARGALAAGHALSQEDLVRREVRFDGQAVADRYLTADADLPAGLTLSREIGTGELVPRAALAETERGTLTEVPLSVGTEAVPATVQVGSVVDVWVTPDGTVADADAPAGGRDARSLLVFDDVAVLALPRSGTSLGPSSTRQVIVGLDGAQEPELPTSLAALAGGTVVITARR